MPKLELPPSESLYPVPVVLVSCIDLNSNRPNIITIAWCGIVCSNPPLITISIRPSRYSHSLIANAKDFVINIPTCALLEKCDFCGMNSGKDVDKFKACSFTSAPSSKISSPMIKECPVNIECKLTSITALGAHDMFTGEVILVHADKDIINKNGRIDYSKTSPIVFNQGEYWSLGKQIGRYGLSAKTSASR